MGSSSVMHAAKNIVHVIPFKKMPRSIDFFDYQVPEALQEILQIGHVVEIPLKKGTILGLVIGFAATSTFPEVKAIAGIHQTTPFLLPYQIELATWFSGYYHYSLASTIKMLVPQIPKRASGATVKLKAKDIPARTLTPEISSLITTLLTDSQHEFIAQTYDSAQKVAVLLALAEACVVQDKQMVIIVPHTSVATHLFALLPADLMTKAVCITADTPRGIGASYKLWNGIKSGETKIIIGTRSAIFMPFSQLGLLWIDDTHRDDLKSWDQNPRYHTVEVARKIHELQPGSRLILASPTPRIVDYASAQQRNIPVVRIGKPWPITITPLTMRETPDSAYITIPMTEHINQSLMRKERVWLIVNKKGFASYLWCKDCTYIPRCGTCDFPYTYMQDHLQCFHCNIPERKPTACPKCKGINLVPLGIGVEQIIDSIKKSFPKVSISDSVGIPADIIITTIGTDIPREAERIGFIGFVYIDSTLYFPDFSTHEKLYGLVHTVIAQVRYGRKTPCPILLQTNFSTHPAFLAVQLPYNDFFKKELGFRHVFQYPPERQLIKLFFQHHDKAVCLKEAKTMANQIQALPAGDDWSMTAPYLYYRQQIRGRFRAQIVIKIKPGAAIENTIIQQLPEYWHIDKDPLSVL